VRLQTVLKHWRCLTESQYERPLNPRSAEVANVPEDLSTEKFGYWSGGNRLAVV
jgi:hypothetical protein